jgi:hypothetical protein
MDGIHFLLLLLKAKINITVSRKGMINHMTIIDTPNNPISISPAVKSDVDESRKNERRKKAGNTGGNREKLSESCGKILQ